MGFDPNKVALPEFTWATYIPDRNPNFKVHKNRGHALNAVDYRKNYILYQRVNDEWIERYRIENLAPEAPCERCTNSASWWSHTWDRDEKGKIAEPLKRLRICSTCKYKVGR